MRGVGNRGKTMKTIRLFNSISQVGLDAFDPAKYALTTEDADAEGILVRSAVLHDTPFPPSLTAIARAGAGVNNIPLERCAENGIVVFNTPGANANGVKELTVLALLLASRRVSQGIEWAKTLKGDPELSKKVEKGKSQFVGPELRGKTLGVIGLGAIGGMVANAADSLGMNVVGCDPFLSVKAAWSLKTSVHSAASYDEIYEKADYITYHIPALPETKGIINRENIAKMKDGVRIVNLSRGDLANAQDVASALKSGKVAAYVTDFPCDELLGVDGAVCTPHLGASTPESEDNCAQMAARELIDYLENGNIRNSVNAPASPRPAAPQRSGRDQQRVRRARGGGHQRRSDGEPFQGQLRRVLARYRRRYRRRRRRARFRRRKRVAGAFEVILRR